MAKGMTASMGMPAGMAKQEDEWQTRDDVDKLMRADEVHSDPKRLTKAQGRIQSVAARLKPKKAARMTGRSSGR